MPEAIGYRTKTIRGADCTTNICSLTEYLATTGALCTAASWYATPCTRSRTPVSWETAPITDRTKMGANALDSLDVKEMRLEQTYWMKMHLSAGSSRLTEMICGITDIIYGWRCETTSRFRLAIGAIARFGRLTCGAWIDKLKHLQSTEAIFPPIIGPVRVV